MGSRRLGEQWTSQKCISFLFEKNGLLICALCFQPFAERSQNDNFGFFFFWKMGTQALLCDTRAHLGRASVLSVYVELSVSVQSAMECQMHANDVFLRCVFERYDA